MDLPFSSSFNRVRFEQLSVKLLAARSKRPSNALQKVVRSTRKLRGLRSVMASCGAGSGSGSPANSMHGRVLPEPPRDGDAKQENGAATASTTHGSVTFVSSIS